jgi:hypothetical protein
LTSWAGANPEMANTSPGIGNAADRIRETAKWLTISLAALGGVLIAGSQLSDIGKLQPFGSRFVVAIFGGGIAAAAAVTILAFTIWVATTPAVSLKNLATDPPAGLGDALTDLRFLDGENNVKLLRTCAWHTGGGGPGWHFWPAVY